MRVFPKILNYSFNYIYEDQTLISWSGNGGGASQNVIMFITFIVCIVCKSHSALTTYRCVCKAANWLTTVDAGMCAT